MELGIAVEDDFPVIEEVKIELPTVEKLLGVLGSGVGLDIAKNHTGVCLFENGKVERYGLDLDTYDNTDFHALFNMRLSLKRKLSEILRGKELNYCIIEDVYGGENFDTVQKLVTLNTVIDELIYEGVVKVDNFYRWAEAKWMKWLRKVSGERHLLKAKYETQTLLEELQDSFYIKNCNASNRIKKEIFFEDICDATGMLCALAVYVSNGSEEDESYRKLSIKDIKMFYLDAACDDLYIDDEKAMSTSWTVVPDNYRVLDKFIIDTALSNPDKVLAMDLPVSRLGTFGIENRFKFYPSGKGVLVWYLSRRS